MSTRNVLTLALAGAFALVLSTSGARAQEGALGISSPELRTASGASVTFINYEGPQSRIDSAAEIVAIGSGLGQALRPAAGKAVSDQGLRRAGAGERYAVQRLVDPSVKAGLEADVLSLGPEAQVDHIKNLRRIISGYLVAAWGYSAADAATLSTFITVYNAVHRGDLAYFAGKYKPGVAREFKADTIGLATTYTEWPGRSAIVIPLTRGATPGSLGAVDTGAVSDKAVVDSLKSGQDQGLGDRQALTELKDKEAAQRQAEAAAKQAEADKAAADLAKKQADLAKAEADLAAAKAAVTPAATPAGGAGGTGTPPAGPEAAKAGAETGAAQTATVTDREKAVADQKAAVAAAQADTAAKQEDAKAAAEAATAKQAEAGQDRQAIAQDQKQAIASEVAAKAQGAPAGLLLLQIVDSGAALARAIVIDPATGKLLRASTLNALHTRAVVEVPDALVAVAGKASGSGAVRLVKLAKADLVQAAESTTDLLSDSSLWKVGEAYYALAVDKGKTVLVRFDATLAETGRGADALNPWTTLTQGPDGLIVQGAGGSFLVLSPDKLTLVKELKP